MKILRLDWMNWVYMKRGGALELFLKEKGVEVKTIIPAEIFRNNREINLPIIHVKADKYYRGFNLKNMVKVEVAIEEEWYNTNNIIEKEYILKAMTMIDWAYDTFTIENPDYIIIEGGLTYYSRACLEVAREMGIGIIAIENSFIKDKIFIEFNTGYVVNRHSFARTSKDWLDSRYLTKSRNREADKIIQNVFKNLNYTTNSNNPIPILKYSRTIVVPLQVTSDQVVLYDTKFNNEQFIDKIFGLARTEFRGWNIILRCHPKEEKWIKNAHTGNWLDIQDLPANVSVIRGVDTVNTQSLLKLADLVFVNNSQAGLEACLLEKPVVVFGDAYYANKGFTLEYNDYINWSQIKENPNSIVNIPAMKLWFLYFYKFLYNRNLTDIDKKRICKELNLQ